MRGNKDKTYKLKVKTNKILQVWREYQEEYNGGDKEQTKIRESKEEIGMNKQEAAVINIKNQNRKNR